LDFVLPAETFGLLSSLIVLPKGSQVSIYTDSQAMIDTFTNLYEQRNTISIRNKLKIQSNNFFVDDYIRNYATIRYKC
jgi:ribonuclease HI